MARIKFDVDLIRSISLIQRITRSKIKDCIDEGSRYLIIVDQGEISKAIGKGAQNVRHLEKSLNKKVRFVEFNPKPLTFIKNLISPLQIIEAVEEEEGVLALTAADSSTRGYIIGRNGQNLRQLESVVKRYFPIKEIKVTR